MHVSDMQIGRHVGLTLATLAVIELQLMMQTRKSNMAADFMQQIAVLCSYIRPGIGRQCNKAAWSFASFI